MPEFTYQKEKKPILEKNRDIHFNLTHCDTGVACGVSGMPIGVDIQDITSYDAQIANYFMSSNELLAVENATNKSDVFTLLWALKESYTKYLGTGILCDLKQIDFSKFICLSCDGGEFELYNMNFKIEKRIFGMLASCSHSKIIHVPLTFNELAENLHNMSNKQNII
ncbi:MAG: 4'-phosphopantetheinyl transferase superfamily protein [Oscillospiraceae bacterium]|nr:4'-phosphopantetheinyl transferase superfamily protein [Oscillospiraceae bacterium]